LIPTLKKMFLAPPDPKAVAQSRKMLATALEKMDRALAQSGPWLAGETYSLADIAAAPVIDRIQRLRMADLWDGLPALKSWVERIMNRPAYKQAAPPEGCRMPSPVAQV
jgi:glutathione S-transferase